MTRILTSLALALLLLPSWAQAAAKPAKAKAPATVVDVYYFHGNARCYSCNLLESLTKEAVEDGFAKEAKAGKVRFHAVNLQKQENEHYIEDFKIGSKTVVVVRSVKGEPESIRRLDQVWMLLRNKKAFIDYVQKNVQAAHKGV
jgi:hypothetical protein